MFVAIEKLTIVQLDVFTKIYNNIVSSNDLFLTIFDPLDFFSIHFDKIIILCKSISLNI